MSDKTAALTVHEAKDPTLALPSESEWARITAIADHLAQSQIVPVAYRRKPHDIVAATLAGRELGLSPMSAMQRIFIIDGKPGLSAEAMVALVHRSGHELWVDPASNDHVAKVYGQRRGSSRVHEMTFTMDEAKAAGITGKDNWKKYPKAMLRARALSALCRTTFADVLAGYVYTPEELGATVDEEGNVIEAEIVQRPAEATEPKTTDWIDQYVTRFGEDAVVDAAEKIRQQLNVGAPITGLGGLSKAHDDSDIARRIQRLLERDYDEVSEAEVVDPDKDWEVQGSAQAEPTGDEGTPDDSPAPAEPDASVPVSPASDASDVPVDGGGGTAPAIDRGTSIEMLDSAITAKLRVGRYVINEGLVHSKAMSLQPSDEKAFTDYADMIERASDELLVSLVTHYKLDERLAGVA